MDSPPMKFLDREILVFQLLAASCLFVLDTIAKMHQTSTPLKHPIVTGSDHENVRTKMERFDKLTQSLHSRF